MSKDTSIFYLRWLEDFKDLSNEQFGRALRAACGLGLPPVDPLARRAYETFYNQFKHDAADDGSGSGNTEQHAR